jgi:hypothetical protein
MVLSLFHPLMCDKSESEVEHRMKRGESGEGRKLRKRINK